MVKTLIINDNQHVVEFIKLSLNKYDFSIKVIKSKEDVFLQIEKEKPHIVILGLVIKEDDGIQLCKEIRQHFQILDFYIVMLSSLKDSELMIESFNAGADDYIVQPLSPQLFAKKIFAILKRNSKQSGAA
jgi:two-component system alkaline phosphatase synthesis response regulator PhoP